MTHYQWWKKEDKKDELKLKETEDPLRDKDKWRELKTINFRDWPKKEVEKSVNKNWINNWEELPWTELRDNVLKEEEDIDRTQQESEDKSQSIKEKQELLETREDVREEHGSKRINAKSNNDLFFRLTEDSTLKFNQTTVSDMKLCSTTIWKVTKLNSLEGKLMGPSLFKAKLQEHYSTPIS